jgi:hypothetical protein
LVSIYVKSSIEVGKGWFVNIYCMSRAALRLEKAGKEVRLKRPK